MTEQPRDPVEPFTVLQDATTDESRCVLFSAREKSSAAQSRGWKTNDVSVRLSPNPQ